MRLSDRVEVDQAEEEGDVGEAIERRVPEGAEPRDGVGDVRHLAVDEVEDVGDDHDDAGQQEVLFAERPGRADIDQNADERENVGMDAKCHAGADDRAQREHADGADEAGNGHS